MAEKKKETSQNKQPVPLVFNDLIPKKQSLDALARKIIKEQNGKKLYDLLDEFKLITLKKELVRLVKLGEFADLADDEIGTRLMEHPERLKNSELVEFSQLIQNSMDRANKHIEDIRENGAVNINANTVNITKNEIKADMTVASREKIANVVMSILKSKGIHNDEPKEPITVEASEIVVEEVNSSAEETKTTILSNNSEED